MAFVLHNQNEIVNLIHGALGNVLVDGMWLANTLTLDSVEFISGILYAILTHLLMSLGNFINIIYVIHMNLFNLHDAVYIILISHLTQPL